MKLTKWKWIAMATAFALAACTDDDQSTTPPGQNGELGTNIEARVSALENAKTSLEGLIGALQKRQEELETELGDPQKTQQEVAHLRTQFDQLNALTDSVRSRVDNLEDAISHIKELDVDGLREQVNTAKSQIDGILTTLGSLEGFDGGEKVKDYIDKVREDLTDALGNYVLKTEYNEFFERYKTFMGDYNTTMGNVRDSLAWLGQQDGQLASRVDALEQKLEELQSQVKNPFDAASQDFLDGVSAIIEKALAEDGKISNAMKEQIDQLRSTYDEQISELQSQVAQLGIRVDKLEEAQKNLEGVVDELKKQIQDGTGNSQGQDGNIQYLLDSLKTALLDSLKTELESQIGDLRTTIDDLKSTNETNGNSLLELNKQIQEMLTTLGSLEGFDGGEKVKDYINNAKDELTASLGNYVLKTEYDEFYKQFTNFMGDYKSSMDSIFKSLAGDSAQIEALQKELATLEEEVKAPFDAASQDFLNGVNAVIEKALAEDGRITKAMQDTLKKLMSEYESRLAALEERVGNLEGKIEGLLGRIQSLVYVPETNDGKIHIGASYIKGGNDSIEVTETKKLKYRVSPANLRDSLIAYLLPEEYTFWQEHVSRIREANRNTGLLKALMAKRAEQHDGLDEFNIVKVEAGTREGEILVTVDNEHDFTHEDLAVALCIKHEDKKSGVLTEFVSPYTTVVKEGEDLTDRFYVAKKEADGSYSKVSRNDVVEYTLRYDDTTPIKVMDGYEAVYDDGETVMSLEEAKAKYEWDGDLTGELTKGQDGTTGQLAGKFDKSGDKIVQFSLKSSATDAIVGATWYATYKLTMKKGSGSVDVVSLKAQVLVLPQSYTVTAEVAWNSDKWNYGIRAGWTSESATYTSASASLSDEKGSSKLSGDDIRQLFADGTKWEIESGDENIVKDEGGLDITATTVSGHLAFLVKGFKYCEEEHTVKLKRGENSEIKTSGAKGVTVDGTLKFVGPSSTHEVTLEDVVMPTDLQDTAYTAHQTNGSGYPLIYLSANPQYPKGKKLPYTDEEITKFFDGSWGKVMTWMAYAVYYKALTLDGSMICAKEGSTEGSPESVTLELVEKGGRPVPTLPTIYVKATEEIKNIKTATTYKIPEGLKIKITDGPTIPIKGTFEFQPKKE